MIFRMKNGMKNKFVFKRVAIMRVCSREAAPLGDPRGVPKLSRLSSIERFLLLRQKLKYFKIRKVIFASQVIILAKIAIKVNRGTMSDMATFDEHLNDIMDIISSDVDSIPSDQFDDLYELLNSDSDMSPVDNHALASPTPPPCDTFAMLPEPEHSHDISGQFETAFCRTDDSNSVIQLHITPASDITTVINGYDKAHDCVENSSPASSGTSFIEYKKDLQIKNNIASKKYREKKKLESELLEQELLTLEQENNRLRAKEEAMARMVSTLRQVYHNMVAQNITASDQCRVLAEFIENMSKSF